MEDTFIQKYFEKNPKFNGAKLPREPLVELMRKTTHSTDDFSLIWKYFTTGDQQKSHSAIFTWFMEEFTQKPFSFNWFMEEFTKKSLAMDAARERILKMKMEQALNDCPKDLRDSPFIDDIQKVICEKPFFRIMVTSLDVIDFFPRFLRANDGTEYPVKFRMVRGDCLKI